jgi:hypothetical protein
MPRKVPKQLVTVAEFEGFRISRPESDVKLRDNIRKRIWFKILWELAINGPQNKYQLARALHCRYSSVHDVVKKRLTDLVEEVGKPDVSRAGLPVRSIGLSPNGLMAILYFDPSILEQLDKVARANPLVFSYLFGNWDAFSQMKDAVAMELNIIAERMCGRHAIFFGVVPFPEDRFYIERALLERILIEPPLKGDPKSVRQKLFSEGKNRELLRLLLDMARTAQTMHKNLLARIEGSVKDLEEYARRFR